MADVLINQGTQTAIKVDTVGTSNYQIIKLDQGAAGVSSLFTGTIPQVTTVGSVVGIGGTVNVDLVGTEPIIVQVGTINAGTINSGTIDLFKAGTITALANGTIGAGTLNTLGTVSNILAGSIAVVAGTIGSLPNVTLAGGTVQNIAGGTLATNVLSGTINTLGTVANISAGSIVVTNGTIGADTSINAVVSATASSTATLAAGGTWTGGTVDLLPYNTVRLSAYSDVNSATDGLKLRFSNDGTNWDITRQTTLSGSLGVYAAFNRVARYYSPQYINGAGSQGLFRLQTVLTPNSPEFTRRFLSEVPNSSNAGIITQANIFGTSTAGGGSFVQVKVAPSGAMQVGGAVDIVTGTITTIAAGTQNTLGTVGVVSSLTTGSIVVTNGTIGAGTVSTNIVPLAGVVKTTATVCGTAATALPASALSGRKSLICHNVGTITCYIGDGTVTTASGIPIGTTQYTPAFDLGTTILYGVSSAASGGTLVVLEVS